MIKKANAFTIVELLIVIVVIAILAAISIVAYTGIQNRARETAVLSDVRNHMQRLSVASAMSGEKLTTIEAMASELTPVLSSDSYRLVTYCRTASEMVVSAFMKTGDIYYMRNGTAPIRDNSLNPLRPCNSLGMTNPTTTYVWGMPTTHCATEGSTCSFSGTKIIAYGSPTTSQYTGLLNLTGSVTCNNATFGDPSGGVQKRCYVIE